MGLLFSLSPGLSSSICVPFVSRSLGEARKTVWGSRMVLDDVPGSVRARGLRVPVVVFPRAPRPTDWLLEFRHRNPNTTDGQKTTEKKKQVSEFLTDPWVMSQTPWR